MAPGAEPGRPVLAAATADLARRVSRQARSLRAPARRVALGARAGRRRLRRDDADRAGPVRLARLQGLLRAVGRAAAGTSDDERPGSWYGRTRLPRRPDAGARP